ncbi:hypothetical protein [Clostridium tagluense]|nr:hypothetical protein [Clostridium tagluense]
MKIVIYSRGLQVDKSPSEVLKSSPAKIYLLKIYGNICKYVL